MSIVTVYIPSPYNVFLYFLERQVHKDNKLGIMTNVGKSRLVKVILTNIHKISDACANSFGRYIMIAMYGKCFYFLINSSFSGKITFLRKLKLIYPCTLQHYNNCSAHTFLVLFKKFLDPPPFKKEDRDYAFYMRDYKGKATKLLPFYMVDFYLQNCKVITFEGN